MDDSFKLLLKHTMDRKANAQQDREAEREFVPSSHHYAAPEVEEWQPHPYVDEGVGRKESLKGDIPDNKTADAQQTK